MDFPPSEEFNCEKAWQSNNPFLHIKGMFYSSVLNFGELDLEYPYDEYFNILTTRILVVDSIKTKRKIEVRHDWEPLDNNIVIYSIVGYPLYADVGIIDNGIGFVMQDVENDSIVALEYKQVFWLGDAEKS